MSREDLDAYDAMATRLDRLIESGAGSSDEANALRDEMDGPWHRMTDAERGAITPPDHLDRYKALTLRLHRLDREGKSETPEAEAIRMESNGPWYAMTDAERDEARRYSGDLDAETKT